MPILSKASLYLPEVLLPLLKPLPVTLCLPSTKLQTTFSPFLILTSSSTKRKSVTWTVAPVGTFAAPGDPSAPPASTAAAAEATIAANTLRFTPYLP